PRQPGAHLRAQGRVEGIPAGARGTHPRRDRLGTVVEPSSMGAGRRLVTDRSSSDRSRSDVLPRRRARLPEIGRLVLRRLGWAIPLLLAVSIVVFLLGAASPFDPIYQYYGSRIFTASAADVARTRTELGLDDPVWTQYADWVRGVLGGDWGTSRTFRQ